MKRILSLILALVMLLGMMPMTAFATEGTEATEITEATEETEAVELTVVSEHDVNTDRLYNAIVVNKGQLASSYDGSIIDSDIYGYVVNYPLKKGHVLSISDTNYVFSVRKYADGNYSTLLKAATSDSFTAEEDMTVGMLIRKPDKSAVTAEELANIVIYDSQFGMIGVEGSVKRFTVEAETIDGGTATTRAAIFLPPSYSETGNPTRLIIMTNGLHGHLSDTAWNANTADDVALMKHYMEAGYAVLVVDNTAQQTRSTTDLGNPQLISSYWEAYEYVQTHFNVEEMFSLHSRSQGTFAAMRIMREHPELVKCALMCGAVTSLRSRFSQNPEFIANRFGFDDPSGDTYEADKVVGYDPYTDVNGNEYDLPPTFWMLSESDVTSVNETVIETIEAHGNDVTTAIYTDTDHSGVCRLNIEACRTDALAFLEKYQETTTEHRFCAWKVTTEATCGKSGEMRRYCADCDHYESMEIPALSAHVCEEGGRECVSCGMLLEQKTGTVSVIRGQFYDSTGEWLNSDIYGCVIGYELKAGHTLSIGNENYVFSVRILSNGNYSTMLKAATSDSFTAEEDMTVAIRVRKPDKSTITDEELADIVLNETYYVEHTHTYTSAVTAPTCTEQGYTTYTCTCGDSYVADLVNASGHKRSNGTCTICGDTLQGKTVSILSHSMSTYAGVSNSTATNSTIGKNDVYYTEGRWGVYQKDTWWQQVIDALGMELLVNNSWSGSCIFMPRKGEASVGYGDRAVNLHNDYTGEEPDIIWIYLGCNDFAYYKDTFGIADDVDYAALIQDNGDGTFTYAEPTTTCEAYAIMLHKVVNRYPDAEIYCMTSTARRETDYTDDSYPDAGQPTEYSAQLQQIATYFGFPVIDLENAIPKDVEIFDKYIADKRAHANPLGMDQISNEVLSVMLGREAEICHVTSADGVVAEQAVLLGGSYNAEVELQEGYSVVVTMDGEDITTEAYSDGEICIEEVTGDIVISATTKWEPNSYRWELKDGLLVSVGETENAMVRLEGTTENGIFIDTRYQMTKPFVLLHDQQWVLEWNMTGPWVDADSTAGKKLFSQDGVQATVGAMAIGTKSNADWLAFNFYNGSAHVHYGIDLAEYGISLSENHTYRLYNKVAEDGSNMIWIAVDGVELGAMNTHLNAGVESDYLSGKDFSFGFLGTPRYWLDNGSITYIQVLEGGHTHTYEAAVTAPSCTGQGYTTYTCECGDSYVDDHVDASGHTWASWQQIAEMNCQGQGRWMRSCETCAAEQYTTDQDGSCVSFNSPAILANAGDTVVLTYYDVAFDADTVADSASIVWSSDQLIIDQGCVTPTEPGVYPLTATSGTVSKTVYLVVKAPEDTEYVLYFDDFTDSTLPGYRPIELPDGALCYVSDGKLILDSSNSTQSYIRILLPEWIGDFGDYEISTTFTMTEALDSTKWFAVMARVQDEDYPYWQAAVRYYATASDGIVIDERTKASGLNNGWNITHTGAYTENISASKYYLQTFGLNGSYGYTAINGTTLLESDTMTLGPGDVGFQVRGAVASIDSIKIVIPVDTSAHTFGDWTVTTAPSCTEPGTETRSCAVCGCTETRDVAPCHDLVQYEEKMHTCTESGWLAYETCTRCDYSTLVEVAPTGHSYQRRIHSVAHRGYSQTAPENTLASYELAKQLGYFYVECDVSFTADGVPVLLHDDTIDRTSDGTGKISELTYEQLLQYDFGGWKSADYAGTSIPTFEEIIALCAELDLHPYIELKSSGNYTQEKVQQLVDIVEAYGMTGKVTWISFSNTFLAYVKNVDPTARLGYVYSGDATESVINTAKMLQTGQNDVFLLLNYSKITNTGILRAATNGFAIEVWTVNSESAILALPSYVSGVVSDKLNAQSIRVDSGITITAPTCTGQGYTTYTCECGESYVADLVDAAGHSYENGTCTGCGDININWEIGTIAAASGANSSNATRLRTTDYLALADFSGVSVNVGYQLTWLAYDADKNYIGNGTATFTGYWQPSGQSIATADIQNLYSNAVYFRLALKAVLGVSMTLEDVQNSGVTFIPFGEALPEPEYELEYESSLNIGSWQDGAIWNGKLFVLGASGTGAVYDLENLSKLATFSLDSADVLKPHANSVCFGSTYYAPGDKYPLLYVNVYNNYASAADRMEGTCCVYRISETDSGFVTDLVQVIEIGFTEDLTLWKSKENNGDVRPYGNFLVDTDENKLYAYVMRDAAKATRFFKFDLPKPTDGIYSETYGCNVVTLESADIEGQFDTEYFNYLQGGTYSSSMIVSAEGFSSGGSAEPAIRIVNLETGTVSATYYMANSGLTAEPEVVCVDPGTGLLYYAPADGTLRILTIPDVHFHSYENGTCTACGEAAPSLAGRTISILGASISTYTGISNNTAYNSTIGSNAIYYTEGRYGVYANDTWWMQVANDLGLRLLVNNSWSGSSLLYERNGTVGAYVDRCVQLHNNDGEEPDIIGIQMGTNDFQYYKDTLGTADIDYDALIIENEDGSYTYATPVTSLEAAAIVLHKISVRYPNAEVYYLNISQRVDGTDELIQSFNAELKQVVEHFGAHIVDIYGSAITMDDFDTYIGDGRVHPNKLGMDAYTEAFKRALIENTAYSVDAHTVSFGLDGVTADYGDDKIVVDGDAFSCTLTAQDGKELSVSVTMGGEDITDTAYENGTISIRSVTADVAITAEATVHEPQNYRWEFDGTDLACVGGGNTLTKDSGTTTDGVFSKTSYTLENEVVLLHDLPWVVEWKCEGTFLNTNGSSGARVFSSDNVNANYNARYIFKSNTNGIIAMGEKTTSGSHNYGIALADHGIDWTALHTYRLENRIAADGSNMVYLYVDGEEIGPMNHYYIGTRDQATTSDWLSGKDFVFPYMGTDTHGFTNASIDYIQVWEGGHTHTYEAAVTAPSCTGQGYTTYTCECGDSYVGDYVDAAGHSYENGTCTGCGVAQWDTDGDGVLEILAIGNSFSIDVLEYAYQIAQNLGIEEIVIGNLYISGCTLKTHAANAADDIANYTYYFNDSGSWSTTSNYKISTALTDRSWDFVSMQQSSKYSGVESTYNEDLTDLIAYVQDRSDAKLVWHMTWAYQQDSTHSAFPTYGSDQMTMYNAIVSAVQNKIATNNAFDLIVPNGTAVQNSRTSLLGDTTTRDGYHMSKDYGRYLTGLLFIKTVTGLSVDGITYAPSGVDAQEMIIAIESVNNAYANPFEVTESAYTGEVPEEGYILLQSELYKGAFWSPVTAERYNELFYDRSMSHKYFATIRFTRDTLPVGSIIILADGWQYRPDGWITDTVQTGSREPTTTESYVVVTEEWWGDYTIRAFNISKVGQPSLTDVTEEEVRAAFRIYVPEDSHIHTNTSVVTASTCTEQGYTTYTCTLCGDSYVGDYVDAAGHSYENGICTGCGAEHPNLANYEGKVISILGDSISTFAGYIPTADGFNLEHLARYPQDNLLTDVNETWWMQVINELDAKLGINDSWRGATVSGAAPVTTGTTGENAAMGNLTRIQNLGSNGTPDVILFYGGTNDLAHVSKVGSFDPSTAPDTVDLTTKKWDNLADGYVHTLLRLQHYYPDAVIIAMLPTYTTSYYSDEKLAQANAVLAEICEHYGVVYVDLRDCGISTADLPDGIHPDATGMDYITEAVVDALLNECEMEAGENVVYSVTHELENAEASLGYYKGVSAGRSFVETISGDDVAVTVTMGGVDITATAYSEGVVSIPAVSGDLVITAKGEAKPIYADYLQQLPEDICAGTNLWTVLEHNEEYYTVNGWGVHSSGQVYSVTIPITPGDQLWATSFQASGSNGGTINGIRLTWFGETDVLESVNANDVYTEFSANDYLTAPEGAVAVNVVMWNGSESNEFYILNRAHSYSGTVCTLCGAAHPNLANYEGKVISILGASICTFEGYIPTADGFNLQHYARYPQDNLLTDVNETWWMQVINTLDAKLGINDSWRSTEVYNACTDEVNSSYDGTKACLSSVTRIQNLGSNGTPDVILFFGATNDITQRRPLGTFDPETAPTEVDLTTETWTTVVDAYTALIMRVQYYYPDAEFVVLLPYSTASNSDAITEEYTSVFAQICAHYGATCIDLNDCGISVSDLPDGTHPNAEGMDYITDAVLDVLLGECEMTPGENVVHSVTHELTAAKSTLSYYKGVSEGKSFTTAITGENVTVTVTMGGVDITDQVYAEGKITISAVTGDVVITAKGIYNADGRLQQLPENYCRGTNLWTLLDPVNEYYTASGWGNNSNSNYSVTFPVSPGDKIWATSFGAAGTNGYSENAVRITWFGEDGVLESLSRDVVYAEFAEYGYITVPEGAAAVNIPMASNADTWEIYILNRDHCYENGTCTGCGAQEPRGLLGDLDLDGEVDADDMTLLARHVAGIESQTEEIILNNADTTGDGVVDADDLTLLARYVAGIITEWER